MRYTEDIVKGAKQELSKTMAKEFTKSDIKKLELIKNLSPKEIEEILHQNTIATRTDRVNIKTEEI
jgi:hypothetical protein